MEYLLFPISAIVCYLISGLNPAIILSKLIYRKDIRECRSRNPGFTNFKRTFGSKWAFVVLIADLSKAAICVAVFAHLFEVYMGEYQLGSAFSGLFCMAGHAYPIWYKFKGGKGFLVYMSVIWFVDWRAGLLAVGILALFLFTTKYMSLSTMLAVFSSVVFLCIAGAASYWVIILCSIQVLFMICRHAKNIKRLINGTESRFSFGSR